MAKAPPRQPAKKPAERAGTAAGPVLQVTGAPATPTPVEPAGTAVPPPPSPVSGGGAGGEGQPIPAIRVTSRREGFRRGGRAWSAQPTTVALAEFTPEQLAQIRAETIMLTVEDVQPLAAALAA